MRLFPRAAAGAAGLLALSTARAQEPDTTAQSPGPTDAKPPAPSANTGEGEDTSKVEAPAARPPAAEPAPAARAAAGAGSAAPPAARGAAAGDPFAPGWREQLH